MKIFRNWFSKQDKEPSPEDQQEYSVSILLAMDKEDENILKIEFEPGYEDRLAELIFLFNSGILFPQSVEVLRQACEDDNKVIEIMQKVNAIAQENNSKIPSDYPLVDPREVFSKKEENEFKG